MTGIPLRPNPTINISNQERLRFGTGEQAREGDRPLAQTKAGTVGRGISLFDPFGKYEKAAKEQIYKDALSGNNNSSLNYNPTTGEYDIPWWQRIFSGLDDQDVANEKFRAQQEIFRRKNPGIDTKIANLNKQSYRPESEQIKLNTLNTGDVLGQVQNEEARQEVRRKVRSATTRSGLDVLPENFESLGKSDIEGLQRTLIKGVKLQNRAETAGTDLDNQIAEAIRSNSGFGSIQNQINKFEDEKAEQKLQRGFTLQEQNPEFKLKRDQSEAAVNLNNANIANLAYNQARQDRQDNIANQISLGNLDLQTTKLGLEAQQAQNNYALQMRQYEADVDYRNRRMEYDRARLGQERMDNIFKILLSGINYV